MNTKFDQNIIHKYLNLMGNDPFHRYWSWDFCFTSFSNRKNDIKENLALSLASYLASWGMYRGSGGLLQKNHRIHEEAVKIIISKKYDLLRCNSTNEVNDSLIPLIMDLKESIGTYYASLNFTRKDLTKNISNTDTLLSKIILGTTGCVPAFDRYFVAGMKISKINKSKFNRDSLTELFNFIENNKTELKKSQQIIKEKTRNNYPVMKIIDMYFWQIGYDSEN